jgi:hypothetical protein
MFKSSTPIESSQLQRWKLTKPSGALHSSVNPNLCAHVVLRIPPQRAAMLENCYTCLTQLVKLIKMLSENWIHGAVLTSAHLIMPLPPQRPALGSRTYPPGVVRELQDYLQRRSGRVGSQAIVGAGCSSVPVNSLHMLHELTEALGAILKMVIFFGRDSIFAV